jgi:hypothetical protein
MTEELRKAVVAAYGGESLWRTTKTVKATVWTGGLAFILKSHRGAHGRVEVDLSRPWTKLHLGPEGMVGVLEGGDVRLETSAGQVLASRGNARGLFPGGRRAFWWDRLDQVYFRWLCPLELSCLSCAAAQGRYRMERNFRLVP